MRAGVYVHFPWCLAKCPYCDFVSHVGDGSESGPYADAVVRELEFRAPLFEGRSVESVFFGGGTPSLWDPRQIGRVLAALRGAVSVAGRAEVTVECNPTSIDERRASALAVAGVNRLSIGVQSLRDERLRFLGRLHDAAGAIAALRAARGAGMRRVSADLIFGLPGQTPSEASAEASEIADLGLDHVSFYQLTIEPATRFGELARRGRLPLADDGAVADSFLAIDETLSRRGLRHYEISNYAVAGEEARHNLGYWRGDEYLGLGCGAFGFVRDRGGGSEGDDRATGLAHWTRWRNVAAPERYMSAAQPLESARDPASVHDRLAWGGSSIEGLDAEAVLRERIMLGLRVRDGVDVAGAAESLGVDGWTAARDRAATTLQARGRLVRDGSRIRIPPAAWLWADDTSARLF